jgi:hypothetical protein
MGGTKEATTSKATDPFSTEKVLTEKRLVVLVEIFPSEGRVL